MNQRTLLDNKLRFLFVEGNCVEQRPLRRARRLHAIVLFYERIFFSCLAIT